MFSLYYMYLLKEITELLVTFRIPVSHIQKKDLMPGKDLMDLTLVRELVTNQANKKGR